MATNEKEIPYGKMLAVYLVAGPPPAALVFYSLINFANRNSDTVLTKINESIQMVFTPYGLLGTYSIYIIPSLLTYFGCSIAFMIATKERARILAAAFIGAFVHFGTGALVMVLGLYGGRPEPVIWLFTAFAGAGGAVSASVCALIVNIYLMSSSEV
jgi:hypothetical protein